MVWPLTLLLAVLLAGGDTVTAQVSSASQDIVVSDPIHYARVFTDAKGETHFADEVLTFELIDFAPPAPPISVSALFDADNVTFISSPAGWYGHWHAAPRRQFILVLEGELEVEVSDGEARRFGPGSICLVEDTTGKGHISRVVSTSRGLAAAIPLASD
jgi:hypothetical protein